MENSLWTTRDSRPSAPILNRVMGNVAVPDAAFQFRIMREESAALDNRPEIVNVGEVTDWRRLRNTHNESTTPLKGLSSDVSHLHYPPCRQAGLHDGDTQESY